MQQNALLFDHLVGAQLKFSAYREPQRLGSLEVDDKLKFSWLLDRKIGWHPISRGKLKVLTVGLITTPMRLRSRIVWYYSNKRLPACS